MSVYVDCEHPRANHPMAWCPYQPRKDVPVETVCYSSCRDARCAQTGQPLDVEAFRECMAGCQRCEHSLRHWEQNHRLWAHMHLPAMCPGCERRYRDRRRRRRRRPRRRPRRGADSRSPRRLPWWQ